MENIVAVCMMRVWSSAGVLMLTFDRIWLQQFFRSILSDSSHQSNVHHFIRQLTQYALRALSIDRYQEFYVSPNLCILPLQCAREHRIRRPNSISIFFSVFYFSALDFARARTHERMLNFLLCANFFFNWKIVFVELIRPGCQHIYLQLSFGCRVCGC